MSSTCNMCKLPWAALPYTIGNMAGALYICRRCDTTALNASYLRAGPPNLPGSQDGKFNATFRDK